MLCLWTGQAQLRHLRQHGHFDDEYMCNQDFITFACPGHLAAGPSLQQKQCSQCAGPELISGSTSPCRLYAMPMSTTGCSGRDPIGPLMRLRLTTTGKRINALYTCNGPCTKSQEQTMWPNAACLVSKENNLI